jgi:cytochrome c oxidase subunit 7
MATIAPIVGKFRRTIIRDIAACLTVSTAFGYVFWQFEHVPKFNRIDNHFKKIQAERDAGKE